MLIEYRSVESLVPYARNSRTHSDEQVAQIMAAMVEFGWTNPVLADGDGIVAGHGRVMAASRLYEQSIMLRLPGGDEVPAGMIPVIDCTGWSAMQRKAYIIADNKLAENARWDSGLLALDIGDLRDCGFDIGMTGFDDNEISKIIDLPEHLPEKKVQIKPISKTRILISVSTSKVPDIQSIIQELISRGCEIDYSGN